MRGAFRPSFCQKYQEAAVIETKYIFTSSPAALRWAMIDNNRKSVRVSSYKQIFINGKISENVNLDFQIYNSLPQFEVQKSGNTVYVTRISSPVGTQYLELKQAESNEFFNIKLTTVN